MARARRINNRCWIIVEGKASFGIAGTLRLDLEMEYLRTPSKASQQGLKHLEGDAIERSMFKNFWNVP